MDQNFSNDFLNPKSMLTPGFAGILVMALANSVSSAIALNPMYIALALSFLVGTLIFQNARLAWARGVYYILNSLIIFNMALGGNTVGLGINNAESANLAIISTAFADPSDQEQELIEQRRKVIETLSKAKDETEQSRLLYEIERISQKIADAKVSAQPERNVSGQGKFFKPWSF
ncbi:MAG: hypothetical protein ACR2RF_02650 [Geminicoccaceae bacterium]